MNILLRLTYARYLLASIGALALDMAVFLAALALMPASIAAAMGYCAGIAAHWFFSSRTVFADRLAEKGAARTQQQLLFVSSAAAGLCITIGIVALGAGLGADPRLAKLAAVGVSFQCTYLLRRKLVFA